MTDFDPDAPINSQEEADAYVTFCIDQVVTLCNNDETPRTYRLGARAAAALWVSAVAPLQLKLGIENYEDHLTNLAKLSSRARCVERSHDHVRLADLHTARGVIECFKAVGAHAQALIDATKCAITALVVANSTILKASADRDAPDVWALVLMGLGAVRGIPGGITYAEFVVDIDHDAVMRMQTQRVNDALEQQMGGGQPFFNPN